MKCLPRWIRSSLALILTATLLAGLWFWWWAYTNQKVLEQKCQDSAGDALAHFQQYQSTCLDEDYWQGVSVFQNFMIDWLQLNDNVSDAEYRWCNTIYAEMNYTPENAQANLQQLMDALDILSQDCDPPQGSVLLFAYYNQLIHEE